MNIAPGTPLWPAEWTAIGSVALAVVTLLLILTNVIVTRQDRQRANRQEQAAEANAIQVVLGATSRPYTPPDTDGGPARTQQSLVAVVVNRSKYTVTGMEAQFSFDGESLVQSAKYERVQKGIEKYPEMLLPDSLQAGWRPSLRETGLAGVLTPWDLGMRFETAEKVVESGQSRYSSIVRWTDRWGERWEHKHGVVRPIKKDEDWKP